MLTVRKAIFQDGKLVGFRLYTTNGLFGALTFKGYQWVL